MDGSPPGSSVPGKHTGVGCHFILQRIFPAQGSNLHLLHWQENSLPLYYPGSPASRQSIAIFGTLACRCITLWFLCCKILLVSYSWRWKSLNRVWLFVDPMDCTVHGILQARILEQVVAIPFFRESSQPRDGTQVSRIVGRFFTIWANREALSAIITHKSLSAQPRWHTVFYNCISFITNEYWAFAILLVH